MPWRACSPMQEKLDFIRACLNRREPVADICQRFGISEKTGYKILRRFREEGEAGLAARSHAPLTFPHRMAPAIAARIIALRKQHPGYGAEKLRDYLVQRAPATHWPAASTIGELLKREGLIVPRRRRAHAHARLENGLTAATGPNEVWTIDFKGEFRLASGPYCYPLTVLDLATHYALAVRALPTTRIALTRQVLIDVFQRYGLPAVIRSDNGVPFAQPNALGRLGALAFWWVRLGIRPEHIAPGQPAQNGAHERFHKTLKADATRPPASSLGTQQARFDHFSLDYNTERPHESQPDHRPPSRAYTPSPRPYPAHLPPMAYPPGTELRRVDASGNIKWRRHHFFLSGNLAGEDVSLTERPGDLVTVAFGPLALGELDPELLRFLPCVRWVG